ncbi:hypothetical protein ACHAPT_001059 [Fusarium lateritium]
MYEFQYDSGLQIPMTPVVNAARLNPTVSTMMLLDYLLLIVIPLFFLLGSRLSNHPVYPGYTTPRPIHPIQKLYERDLYRALFLFWPSGLMSAWFAIRQICRDPGHDFRVQLPPLLLGFLISCVTYRIADLSHNTAEERALVQDDEPATDQNYKGNVGGWGLESA